MHSDPASLWVHRPREKSDAVTLWTAHYALRSGGSSRLATSIASGKRIRVAAASPIRHTRRGCDSTTFSPGPESRRTLIAATSLTLGSPAVRLTICPYWRAFTDRHLSTTGEGPYSCSMRGGARRNRGRPIG